jgi:tetratricopeptide (TPR) repeat protein
MRRDAAGFGITQLSDTARPSPPAEPGAAPRAEWAAVRALFERLLDQPPFEREAALAAEGVAEAVAREVRELFAQLDADAQRGHGFLDAPAPWAEATPQDLSATLVGPWRVTSLLGSGGMGEVWEAQRADGAYEARVAIKVLRLGDQDALRREHFAQETRLLARLNHPHIARLLDAGRLEDGRPYFVMEAVQGRALDEAAAGEPLVQRLRLFLQLADAVAYAHRQGLVHRDLKPSNVLVTADGQVKLLDFGIAHALDRAPDAPQAPRPLTPGYASPEQVRGEPVAAPSDVYALGVILHVLLTGVRPYGRGANTVAEALQAVLHEPPTQPSAAPPGDGADAGVPRRSLSGDLDAIVLKALAKSVADRYPTVQALADDLRAHLEIRPVAARPRTVPYVAGRFARRHRGAVAAVLLGLLAVAAGVGLSAWQARDAVAALAVLSLATGAAVSAWQARLARTARDEARARMAETSGLVRDVVMRYADTVTFLPGGLQMKADLLRDTLAHLERLATGARADPELAGETAKAHARLADILVEGVAGTLAKPQEAGPHLDAALDLFAVGEPAHRGDPSFWVWWARAMRARAVMARGEGDAEAALRWRLRQRDLLREALRRVPDHPDLRHELASALFGIGSAQSAGAVAASLDDPAAAEAAFAEADALYRALADAQPQDVTLQHQLGAVAGGRMLLLQRLGRLDEALEQGRLDMAFKERAIAMDPLNVACRESLAGEANNFTALLLEAGRTQEALEVSARGEAVILALQADDPGVATWSERRRWFALQRGRALVAAGQPQEALPRLQDAMQPMESATAPRAVLRRALCGATLAQAQLQTGLVQEAGHAAARAAADLEAAQAGGLGQEPTARLVEVALRDLEGPPRASAT